MSSRISTEWRTAAPGVTAIVFLGGTSELGYAFDVRIGFMAQLTLMAGAFLFFVRTASPSPTQIVYQRVTMTLVPIIMARLAFVVMGGIDWPRPALGLVAGIVAASSLIGVARSGRLSARTLGFSSRLWFVHAPLGILAGLGAGRLLIAFVPIEPLDLEGWSLGTGSAIAAVVVAAVIDDVMYRGSVLGTLAESTGRSAIVWTALLYAVGFAGFEDPEMWAAMAVVGLALGVWRLAAGSLIGTAAATAGLAVGTLVPWPIA